MRYAVAILISMLAASPAMADFQRVKERESFISLIQNRALTRVGIRLQVTPDGRIRGRAFGRQVSGAWNWNGGYFCRDLFVNGSILDAQNCQTVEVRGNTLRFTSDKGQGDYADLRLK